MRVGLTVALLVLGTLTPALGKIQARSASKKACQAIRAAISSASEYYEPGTSGYEKDISHWATSSVEQATCSVEPGTAQDVGKILKLIHEHNAPFAVKGGGHNTNPGFSSTTGVQIAMYKFSEVTYDAASQTVEVGAGLVWDDVYAALEPHGVNVVGGRVNGVGVAGFSLGGGFSWLSNQYGLTVDNIVAFELVLPSGTVRTVDSSTPDLFAGLKGGYNNFGIVTTFTLKTYTQGQVWGGLIVYAPTVLDSVTAATATFCADVTDPKAQIIASYDYSGGTSIGTALLFYDGPSPPSGVFDSYLAIPSLSQDISTRSFISLIGAFGTAGTAGERTRFNTASLLEITPDVLNAVYNESIYWGTELTLVDSNFVLSYNVEPFLPSLFSHAAEGSSVFPPSRAQVLLPLDMTFTWTSANDDPTFVSGIVQSAQQIANVAEAGGQDIADLALYGNYAVTGTPVERIFGDQLSSLESLKSTYDPHNVMGLAGGWKV